ncbi:hypothetical protein [Amylibacter sp. IMCC11727]|uniref:hypothetical protein n=1 Tax=Amylibacter sp. IMCC11727 TaxID=3039851 RepID=UPI00244D9C5E|nr:hypothetical protein [Amylibacter sp. IMCC11727]WGI21206.1 hypothetical protein QBD29_13960 [Amylibacter sp. IMCC11727]
MDIRIHIGVHRTGTQHLRKMLALNSDLLAANGVCVPEPEFSEKAFARAVRQLKAGEDVEQINADLLSTLTQDKEYRRIVMVDPNVSGTLMRPIGKEFFYPRIGTTINRIVTALEGLPTRLFVCIRNPATFIPSCYSTGIKAKPEVSFDHFVSEANLPGLRWSDFLHRAQMKKADLPMTVWRFEDYPFIWRDVVQALTGIENREELVGSTAPVNAGLSLRGAILMHRYLQENNVATRAEFERVRAAFDQKFPSHLGHNHDLHWPEELTEGMSENYEDDWYYIERMENVETITAPQVP